MNPEKILLNESDLVNIQSAANIYVDILQQQMHDEKNLEIRNCISEQIKKLKASIQNVRNAGCEQYLIIEREKTFNLMNKLYDAVVLIDNKEDKLSKLLSLIYEKMLSMINTELHGSDSIK